MTKLNCISITCHDLGRHLRCYGYPTVNSPNLDRMANEGARFSNLFCTAPQCSPSRASIYTGRYPHSTGMMGLAQPGFGWDMREDVRHMAGILRQRGWKTALVGFQHERFAASSEDFELIAREDGVLTQPIADRAIEFIEQTAATDSPFYLQVGFIKPHRLNTKDNFGDIPDDSDGAFVPPYLVDEPSARAEFAAFQGAIREMDAGVGALLAAVDRLGLREKTVIAFTSDHGIPFPRAKCSVYDPGLEVPLILRLPRAMAQPGQTIDALLSNIDIMPSLLELLGVPSPSEIDGRSFASAITGSAPVGRDAIFGEMTHHDYYDPRRCIRTATHKLIVNFSTAPAFMDPSQDWRPKTITRVPSHPRYAYHPLVELFDLRTDPLEQNDLADSPDHAAIRVELLARLHAWMVETADPLLQGPPPAPMHHSAIQALEAGSAIMPTKH